MSYERFIKQMKHYDAHVKLASILLHVSVQCDAGMFCLAIQYYRLIFNLQFKALIGKVPIASLF